MSSGTNPTPEFRMAAQGFFVCMGAFFIGVLAGWLDSLLLHLSGIVVFCVGFAMAAIGAFDTFRNIFRR